jgi:hypothetical protein
MSLANLKSQLQHLRAVRLQVLQLHKALLNSERLVYEQFYGPIPSPSEFFQLVISHDWFDWLRPISQLIVQMDDVLKSKDPITSSEVTALLDQTRSLLQPDESGTHAEKQYFRAIQRDPEIALMHAEISSLLASSV